MLRSPVIQKDLKLSLILESLVTIYNTSVFVFLKIFPNKQNLSLLNKEPIQSLMSLKTLQTQTVTC